MNVDAVKLENVRMTFGNSDFDKGQKYFNSGRVNNLTIDVQNDFINVTAKVQGTDIRPYTVTARIRQNPKNGRIAFQGDCTCPVEYMCKHQAAVMIAVAHQKGKTLAGYKNGSLEESQNPNDSKRQFTNWLGRIQNHITVDQAPVPQDQSKKSIFYILVPNSEGKNKTGIHVKIVTSNILKRGGYAIPRDFSVYQLRGQAADFITEKDSQIGALLNGGSSYHYSSKTELPNDTEVSDIIMRRMIETGRCFFRELAGYPLSMGPVRAGRLGWFVQKDGGQNPVLNIKGVAPMIF